ncbi:MAG: hypothetical protein KF705_15260 [Phycisphaeraceae bacterium]|nr:hypothetical protein [Phycisphaeraceae bacterium]
MLKHAPTLIIVTIVTAVIWLFAEGENVQRAEIVASMQVVPGSTPGLITWVESDTLWDGRVLLRASGATVGIDRLRDRLRQPVLISPGTDGFSLAPGNQTLDLRSLLRQFPEIRETGVSIEECEPRTIVAHVDVVETIELPVRVDVADAEVEGLAEANPARISVQVPSLAKGRLAPDAALLARIGTDAVRGLGRGRRETLPSVVLELPPELLGVRGVRLSSPTTRVSLTLRERTVTELVPSVPVHIRVAPGQLAKWQITIPENDQFLRDVRVTGPSEEIERIRKGELRIIAMVALSSQELQSGITSKAASFSDLPSTLQFQIEDPIVSLEIRPIGENGVTPSRTGPSGSGAEAPDPGE